MKKLPQFILVILIGLTSVINAQEVKINWGNEAKANEAKGGIASMGWHHGLLYNLEKEYGGVYDPGGDIILTKLSSDMKVVLSKKLKLRVKKYIYGSVYGKVVGDKLKIYTVSFKNKKVGGEIVCSNFDLEGNFLSSEVIWAVPGILTSLGRDADFFYRETLDKKGFYLTTSLTDRELNVIKIHVVKLNEDDDLISEYNTSTSLGNTIAQYINQVEVNSEGNLIVNYRTRNGIYKFEKEYIAVFNKEGKVIRNEIFKLKDFYLKEINMKTTDSGDVYVAGHIVSKDGYYYNKNGFFMAKFNKETYNIENIHSFVYNETFFKSLGFKVDGDGNVAARSTFDLEVFLNKEGGGFLVANHNYGTSNKELVVFSFNEDIKMSLPTIIPRYLNSHSALTNGLGYFAFAQNKSLFIVYTDHIENVNINRPEDVKELDDPKDKKAATYLVIIEEMKEAERKIIVKENAINGYLIPSRSQASKEKVILNFGNKRKALYGELEIESTYTD